MRVLLFCLWLIPTTLFAAAKPNIILILANDMETGEPNHVGALVPIPVLDKTAKEFPQIS